jgi:uncharacterized membrane protein
MPDDPSPWLAVFGRAHPMLLHLPLGILPCTALLEFGTAALRRQPPRGAVLALAWFGALTGALAAATGLVLAGEGGYGGDTIGQHKVLGIALAVLLLASAILAHLASRAPMRIALALALVVMLPAGHLGGALTHGANFLWQPLERRQPADPASAGGGTEQAGSHFDRVIAPILERTCTKCHNPDKKKGELLLTSREGIELGGDNGVVVIAGKPDESPLVTRLELPLDHDDHMPPEDKPQLTAEEIAALRAWIANGARFD